MNSIEFIGIHTRYIAVHQHLNPVAAFQFPNTTLYRFPLALGRGFGPQLDQLRTGCHRGFQLIKIGA